MYEKETYYTITHDGHAFNAGRPDAPAVNQIPLSVTGQQLRSRLPVLNWIWPHLQNRPVWKSVPNLHLPMTVNSTGTVTNGEESETSDDGTWKATDNGYDLTIDDETITATLTEGALTMNIEGVEMVFEKGKEK